MNPIELELKPIDFITIGTIGPKGKRVFHLQAGQGSQLVTFTIEKEQAWALAEALRDIIDTIDAQRNQTTEVELAALDMDLREPIVPLFRVAQMGLGWDEDAEMVVLMAQEMVVPFMSDESTDNPPPKAGEVRMWATLAQMRALSLHAMHMVEQGRPSPRLNGRITYYWL